MSSLGVEGGRPDEIMRFRATAAEGSPDCRSAGDILAAAAVGGAINTRVEDTIRLLELDEMLRVIRLMPDAYRRRSTDEDW